MHGNGGRSDCVSLIWIPIGESNWKEDSFTFFLKKKTSQHRIIWKANTLISLVPPFSFPPFPSPSIPFSSFPFKNVIKIPNMVQVTTSRPHQLHQVLLVARHKEYYKTKQSPNFLKLNSLINSKCKSDSSCKELELFSVLTISHHQISTTLAHTISGS